MAGSDRLRTIVREALQKMASLSINYDKVGMRDFVIAYGGQELLDLLDKDRTRHLDQIIAQERQGSADQPPLILMVRAKGETYYRSYAVSTTDQKNQYLRRQNVTLVSLREKAKTVRDQIEAAGDRAAELFLVGLALDDEAKEIVRVQPMSRASLQLMFPDWLSEGYFGNEDEMDD